MRLVCYYILMKFALIAAVPVVTFILGIAIHASVSPLACANDGPFPASCSCVGYEKRSEVPPQANPDPTDITFFSQCYGFTFNHQAVE